MSGPQGPSVYQLKNEPQADANAMANIAQISGGPNEGANAVKGLGASLAGLGGSSGYNPADTVKYGNAESNLGLGMVPWASAAMNAGMDPQSALYSRTAQQLQEQVRAGQSARGIAMSPYGAAGEADAMNNFNIDWQNQQLSRMLQGLSGAGGALQTAGGLIGQGQSTAESGPGSQVDWFSKYAQVSPAAYAQYQTGVGDNLQYLDTGTNAILAAIKGFGTQSNASSGWAGGLGSGIGALGSLL